MEWKTQQPRRQHQRKAQQRMIVLAGLPGAGKSTLAQRLQAIGWVIINQVREQLPLRNCPVPSWAQSLFMCAFLSRTPSVFICRMLSMLVLFWPLLDS